jgi:hypothetical protein
MCFGRYLTEHSMSLAALNVSFFMDLVAFMPFVSACSFDYDEDGTRWCLRCENLAVDCFSGLMTQKSQERVLE